MNSAESSLSILLVEDNADDEALIIMTAKRNGLKFKYRRVENLEDFKYQLSIQTWDLVLSDYYLPAFSVHQVLNILNSNAQKIPCIVISGYIDEETAVSLMKAGAFDFIPKNNLSRLVPAIRREVAEARNRFEMQKVEQSLRQNQKLISGIAWALGEGLLVSNEQGEIIFVNPEALRLLGWSESELLGKKLNQTVYNLQTDELSMPERRCRVTRFSAQGVPIRSEQEQFVRKDGSTFHVSYVSTQIIEEKKIVAIVTVFKDITDRKHAEWELIESRSQFRELSNFLLNVREEERTRIARELHDELGQVLTALRIDIAWLISRLGSNQQDLESKATNMLKLIESTVESVRRISANLRPSLLDDLGFSAAAEWLLEEFKKRTGIDYIFELSDDDLELDPEISTSLFRILQEAINNVTKHAQASQLYVTLQDEDQSLFLSIKDNGIGFDVHALKAEQKSFGLLGIRERVSRLGGHFKVISKVGDGTELSIRLPKGHNV